MTTDLLPLLDIRNEMSSKTCSIDFPFAAGPISNSNQLGCHGHIANTELARIYAAYAIWHHYRSLDVDLECFRSIVEDLPECVRLRLRINEVGHLSPLDLMSRNGSALHAPNVDIPVIQPDDESPGWLLKACASSMGMLASKSCIASVADTPVTALANLRSLGVLDMSAMSTANPSIFAKVVEQALRAHDYGVEDVRKIASCRPTTAVLEAAALSLSHSPTSILNRAANHDVRAALLDLLNRALAESGDVALPTLSAFIRLVTQAYLKTPTLGSQEADSLRDALPAIKHFVLDLTDDSRDTLYPLVLEIETRLQRAQ